MPRYMPYHDLPCDRLFPPLGVVPSPEDSPQPSVSPTPTPTSEDDIVTDYLGGDETDWYNDDKEGRLF